MKTELARLTPALAVLGSIVSLCIGTSYGKQLFPLIGAEGTVTFRAGFAAMILLAIWRPWRLPLSAKNARTIALYGATLGLLNLTFYMSLATLPLGIAIAIEFMGPLAVAIISSRKLLDFVWICFAIIGVALLLPIVPGASALNPIGLAYALTAAVLWALYIIFGKRAGDVHEGQATSLGMLVATAVVLPFGIHRAGIELINPALLGTGLALAIASSAIPFTLEMFALKRLPRNTFGILLSMEPAVGAISGFFLLDERLSTLQLLAIGFIMVASIGSSMSGNRVIPETTTPADIPADAL